MLLIPRDPLYKKQQKGRPVNKINKVLTINYLKKGSFYLKVIESGRITSKQLETLYQSLNKYLKKSGKIILKVFPHTPLTKKPIEVRMGKGKGNVSVWVAKVKAGSIICEVISKFDSTALKALIYAKQKLPLKTKICNL
jgi:large subunit ribosomal protein L16